MNIIEREHIDIKKWNTLVNSSPGASLFSHSAYLDSVAENWCVLVDDDYSNGMALPYTIRMGVKGIYTPNFSRYLEWFHLTDKKKYPSDLMEQLQFAFKLASFSSAFMFDENFKSVHVYQINDGLKEYNKLSNRMLKKFTNSSCFITESNQVNQIIDFIHTNLNQKVPDLSSTDFSRFNKLVASMNDLGVLKVIGVYDHSQSLLGGAFFIEQKSSLLYLKGACLQDAQNEGAMYALIDAGIKHAEKQNKIFDYGGSRIPGVRQFFMNIGGYDKKYYHYQWNNSSIPVKTAYYIKKILSKNS